MGALTTTTPVLTKQQPKKDMLRIMEAHDLPYLATTSSAYPIDLYDKFVKAKRIKGARYMQIAVPCPPEKYILSEDAPAESLFIPAAG